MDLSQNTVSLLEQFPQAVFLVKDDVVVYANPMARSRGVFENAALSDLIAIGLQEYDNFQSGKLMLTTVASGIQYNSIVTNYDQYRIFCMESAYSLPEFRAFANAAQTLRAPLSNISIGIDELLPAPSIQQSPELLSQVKSVNKSLHELLRAVRNMSDVGTVGSYGVSEVKDISAILSALTEKANTLFASTSRKICFEPSKQPIFCLVNQENLERAILNLISNAIKYADDNHQAIQLSVHQGISRLYISVQSECRHAKELLDSSLFSGFAREPSISDGASGIGLGLTIVHNIATAHKGTLLIEQPSENSLRFTLSVAATKPQSCTVKSPIMHIDNNGGFDLFLVELAEVLPPEVFG